MPAQVDVVEELGSDAFLYGHLTDDAGAATTVVVQTGGRSGARRGDLVSLTPSVDDLHLFHPESGVRI